MVLGICIPKIGVQVLDPQPGGETMNRMREGRRNRGFLHVGTSIALVTVMLVLGATSADASSGVVIREPRYGFSFTLPVGWKQVPLNGSDVTALLNSAAHDDPTLANALKGEVTSAASKGMKVFAIGPFAGSMVPNVNVIVESSAGAPTGRAFDQTAIAEAEIALTQVGASHIKTSIVKNRLGTSAQATYELDLKATGIEFGEQFYVQHRSHVVIVTVTSSSLASSQSNAGLVADSWRW
jgi:hypothetical protein